MLGLGLALRGVLVVFESIIRRRSIGTLVISLTWGRTLAVSRASLCSSGWLLAKFKILFTLPSMSSVYRQVISFPSNNVASKPRLNSSHCRMLFPSDTSCALHPATSIFSIIIPSLSLSQHFPSSF
ncbi:hypothetical protein F4782DRAFT_305865 [Xylaria castorea]|nr:hypothetical protein F4782DRAFT_305865 [Xylaria castorea]